MGKIKQFIKQKISLDYLNKFRFWKQKFKINLYGLLIKSPRLSALYYTIFSNDFIKEQHGVMSGVYTFYKRSYSDQGTRYLLRRNIHRLEKGLLMKQSRNIFALDYITETVLSYKKAINSCSIDERTNEKELIWAHDVLEEYFRKVGTNPILDEARLQFVNLSLLIEDGTKIPFVRQVRQNSLVTYDDLLDLSYQRKSIRWFLEKKVPRYLIDLALKVASQAPSACNRQPFEFRIIDDPELIQKIGSIPGGAKGFFQNFPVIVVVVGKFEAFFSEHDRHLIFIDSSLAVMALMYALETLGLGSCGINWHSIGIKEKKISKLLSLSQYEQVIMLIALGFPDPEGKVAYSQKKELNFIRRYNVEN